MNEKSQISNLKSQTKLKVCGLTDAAQAKQLANKGVEFLGFIFYEKSPRYALNQLSLKDIAEIPNLKKVGIFVNESVKGISETIANAQLEFVQLHGDETPEFIEELRSNIGEKVGIIKVIRVGNQSANELHELINQQPSTIDYFLFDTDSKAYGGTGKTFDWEILNQIVVPKPYFLSGGISLDNSIDLKKIKNQPYALDINSKFEVEPGIKDLEKIKQFLMANSERLMANS